MPMRTNFSLAKLDDDNANEEGSQASAHLKMKRHCHTEGICILHTPTWKGRDSNISALRNRTGMVITGVL